MSEPNKALYRRFRGELNALTFNSKPIITRLSMLAGENSREAETILKAIQDHLRMTTLANKLPAFYLLDSIVKNVGGPYLYLMSGRVKDIFIETWRSGNDLVKAKMERVLGTWKNGFEGSFGKSLFQPFILRSIEEELNRLNVQAKRADASSTASAIPTASAASININGAAAANGDYILDKLTSVQESARKRSANDQTSSKRDSIPSHYNDSRSGSLHHNGNADKPMSPRRRSYHESRGGSGVSGGASNHFDSSPVPHYNHSTQDPASKRPRVSDDSADHGHAYMDNSIKRNKKLLQDVNKLLIKKQIEQLRKPNDASLFGVVAILGQIKQLVTETVLPKDQIDLIHKQLAEIDSEANTTLPNNSKTNSPSSWATNGSKENNGRSNKPDTINDIGEPEPTGWDVDYKTTATKTRSRNRGPSSTITAKKPLSVGESNGSSMKSSGTSTPTKSESGPSKPDAAPNKLIQNLLASPDLVSSLSKIAPSFIGTLGNGTNAGDKTEYVRFDLLEPIALTHQSITRVRPGIYNILYKGYPNICQQCGWRSADSREGKEMMDKHLDWHFRRNRRSQQDRVRKAGARGWYIGRERWEAGVDDLGAGQEAAGTSATSTSTVTNGTSTNGSGPNGKDGAENSSSTGAGSGVDESKTVVVNNKHNNSCPVCKEQFERRFSDDDEDWVFVNAVLVDGTVYHASCYTDLSSKGHL